MKKSLKMILVVIILAFLLTGYAHAVATLGGTLIRKVPGKRMIVLKLKSGTEKKVILAKHCKAYRMNQRAILSQFRIGEQIVIKICSPLNANPLRAEIIMDKYSAAQYSSYKTTTPVYNNQSSGGGFATTCGAAPTGLPPVTGVYPHATHGGWPNNNSLPDSVKMGGGSPQGGKMVAAPSPWGSPAIGAVLSGGSGNQANWGNPSTGGGSISSTTTSGGSGSVISTGTSQGVTPNQGAWTVNPTAEKKKKKSVTFHGKVFQVNHNYNAIYVNQFGSKKTYTVMIRPKTRILDHMTKQPLTLSQIRLNLIVQVRGSASIDGIVDAATIIVQRR